MLSIRSGRRLGLERLESRQLLASDLLAGELEFRSLDGSGNNRAFDDWGAANTALLRLTTVEYGTGSNPRVEFDSDGNVSSVVFPPLAERRDSQGETINPRTVSNLIFQQDAPVLNDRGLTGFLFQWGQFLDHDLDLTEDFAPVGSFTDTFAGEDMSFADDVEIPMLRSRFTIDDNGVAQQINQITSYIDASNVYGSDAEKAEGLRAHYGGFLLTSDGDSAADVPNRSDGSGNFLPFNTIGLENAAPPRTGTGVPIDPDDLFVAGDVRSNEQPGLTSLHTLFVLEHNYQARRIADELGLTAQQLADPETDEYLYQHARAIVAAEVQSITYNEFIPALFGPDQLASYRGYQADVNASIANIFSASLYRVGHTMLPEQLLVLRGDGNPVDDFEALGATVAGGTLDLGAAFFNPELITAAGIEPYLKGLAELQIQEIDNLIVDAVRNLLFDPPAAIDLGATNLQRGRDHGLPDYNQTREDFGLSRLESFDQLSSNPDLAAALATAYAGNINNIDVFAAAISEDHLPGGSVGELLNTVLLDQFRRLRDGDRFYYENQFRGRQLQEIQATRLADIIRRNTGLQDIQDEVFRDDRVFTFRGDSVRGEITLHANNGELEISNRGRLLASQLLTDTDIVVIFGDDRRNRIRIDSSVADQFAGSIEIHGGARYDTLVVEGTSGNDSARVAATSMEVETNDNELALYFGNSIENVEWWAGDGDDTAVTDETDRPVLVNLLLAGGDGDDLMMGGSGGDILAGGRGRDLLIGGGGRDLVLGGLGQDLLIGGRADADLSAIQHVWLGADDYRDKIEQIRAALVTVDDDAKDFLFGGFGRDWFLTDDPDWAIDRWFWEPMN